MPTTSSATFEALSHPELRSRTPRDADDLLELAITLNRRILVGRPETKPGEIKTVPASVPRHQLRGARDGEGDSAGGLASLFDPGSGHAARPVRDVRSYRGASVCRRQWANRARDYEC